MIRHLIKYKDKDTKSMFSKYLAIRISQIMRHLPSTREVSNVTFAAFLRPAGSAIPILSNLSLRFRPPSFDFALKYE